MNVTIVPPENMSFEEMKKFISDGIREHLRTYVVRPPSPLVASQLRVTLTEALKQYSDPHLPSRYVISEFEMASDGRVTCAIRDTWAEAIVG